LATLARHGVASWQPPLPRSGAAKAAASLGLHAASLLRPPQGFLAEAKGFSGFVQFDGIDLEDRTVCRRDGVPANLDALAPRGVRARRGRSLSWPDCSQSHACSPPAHPGGFFLFTAITHHDTRSGFGKLVISFGSVAGRVRQSICEECHGMVWRENMDSGYPNFQLDTCSGGSRRNLAYLLIRTLMGRIGARSCYHFPFAFSPNPANKSNQWRQKSKTV